MYTGAVTAEGSWVTRRRATRPLAHREFRTLLASTTVQNLTFPLQFLTLTFWVQDHHPDDSVLFVSLIAASRGAGMLIFSFIGGALADRYQRRRVVLACEWSAALNHTCAALVMITTPLGDATVFLLLLFTFGGAGIMAVDGPSRSASIPAVVPPGEMPTAISLNMLSSWIAFPLVFPFIGLLNSVFDPGQVYLGSVAAWAVTIPLVASLRYSSTGEPGRTRNMLGDIRAGLAYTRGHGAIFGVIAIVFVLHVIGMPGPGMLGPLWMTEVLDLSRSQFGIMGMTWGLGAIASGVFFALNPAVTRRGRSLCAMVALFAVCAIIFAHSRFVPLTAVANFGLGFGMSGTMVTATTLAQFLVSDEMRGRVMGLFPLLMGLSQLNSFPVGVAAQATSLELVLPVMAWLTLALAAFIIIVRPAMRQAQPSAPAIPVPAAEPGPLTA